MPAVAAHYKFGQLVLEILPEDIKKIIKDNKDIYNIGLQGPDILFYYKPYKRNAVSKYGSSIHRHSGKSFLENAYQPRENNSYLAYLFGCICHYTLDRFCHPYINDVAKTQREHQRLESDFDKLIMEQYNMGNTRYNFVKTPSKDNIELIKKAYPKASLKQVEKGVKSINFYTKLLENKKNIVFLEKLIGNKVSFSSLAIDDEYFYTKERDKLNTILENVVLRCKENIIMYFESRESCINHQNFSFNYEGVKTND